MEREHSLDATGPRFFEAVESHVLAGLKMSNLTYVKWDK
jgi:hypothetical protein